MSVSKNQNSICFIVKASQYSRYLYYSFCQKNALNLCYPASSSFFHFEIQFILLYFILNCSEPQVDVGESMNKIENGMKKIRIIAILSFFTCIFSLRIKKKETIIKQSNQFTATKFRYYQNFSYNKLFYN